LALTLEKGIGFDAMGNKITLAQDVVPLPLLETVQSLEVAAEVCYSSPSPILFPSNKFLPSIVQAPKLDLKVLPEHLKYVYLGENETLPVIISSSLEKEQEERLIEVLKRHKTAIGWTLADIKGISPTMCVHRILFEDGAKPTKEGQ